MKVIKLLKSYYHAGIVVSVPILFMFLLGLLYIESNEDFVLLIVTTTVAHFIITLIVGSALFYINIRGIKDD